MTPVEPASSSVRRRCPHCGGHRDAPCPHLRFSLSPLTLGPNLFAILADSLTVAMAIRWIAGPAMIKRHKQSIHGINILLLLASSAR